jgi:hypothetical protein
MLNSTVGRRGMDIRGIRLQMLFTWNLRHVKPVACDVVAISFRKEKTNPNSREKVFGWMKSAERLGCGQGTLANHLVSNLKKFNFTFSYFGALYQVWMNDINRKVRFIDMMKNDLLSLKNSPEKPYRPRWWNLVSNFFSFLFFNFSESCFFVDAFTRNRPRKSHFSFDASS